LILIVNESSPSMRPVTNQGFNLDCEETKTSEENVLLLKFKLCRKEF